MPFVERTIVIRALPDTVFRFFTDNERFARWWGEGSTVEARVGGEVVIRYPGGTVARGEVVEVVPGERFAFTYGYDRGEPIPPGGSTVTLTLTEVPDGTRLHLRHDVDDQAVADMHRAGWAYQMAVFATVAAEDQHAGLSDRLDRWYAAWSEPDADARRRLLAEVATAGVSFRNRYGCTSGLDDLVAHIDNARAHLALSVERSGEPEHCQGTAVVAWSAGEVSGRDVVTLAPDGRIAQVVGFWP